MKNSKLSICLILGLQTALMGSLGCSVPGRSATFQAFDNKNTNVVPSPGFLPTPAPSPSPAPSPNPTAFPNATNTGVPAGVALTPSGSITVSTPFTVIDALDIHGTVDIIASNVTLKRSRITTSGFYQVRVLSGLPGVVIEDCEVNGVGVGNDGSNGIWGPGTFLRNNIYNVTYGIVPEGGSLIQDNYIHNFTATGTQGFDGIQINGGIANVLIQHNTILNSTNQRSAIFLGNYFGLISNITINNNRLVGGTYTVISDSSLTSHPVTGIAITNNRLGPGQSGYFEFTANSPSESGNLNDSTGLPIP